MHITRLRPQKHLSCTKLTVNRILVTLRNCVLLKTLLIGVSNASKLHTFSSLCLVAYEVKLKTMEIIEQSQVKSGRSRLKSFAKGLTEDFTEVISLREFRCLR